MAERYDATQDGLWREHCVADDGIQERQAQLQGGWKGKREYYVAGRYTSVSEGELGLVAREQVWETSCESTSSSR